MSAYQHNQTVIITFDIRGVARPCACECVSVGCVHGGGGGLSFSVSRVKDCLIQLDVLDTQDPVAAAPGPGPTRDTDHLPTIIALQ